MPSDRLARVAVYDASAALGGSLTSAAALADVIRAEGVAVELVSARAVEPDIDTAFDEVTRIPVQRFRDVHGARYFARETTRARALRKRWAESRPDVVLLNNGPATNFAGWLAARSLGVPAVQYVRGPLPDTRLTRALLGRVEVALTVGDDATAAVRSLGGEARRVSEGLSPAQWPTARATGATDWLFAASGHTWKGAREVIQAYGDVSRDRPLPTLWVCLTRGSCVDPVSLPDDLPAGVRVVWDPDKFDALRAQCRAFLHASRRPEPFGRALLEAMAAGLCPVATGEGGPADLVQHGVTGHLFAPRDDDAARGALRWLADAPDVDLLGSRAAIQATRYRASTAFAPVMDALRAAARS